MSSALIVIIDVEGKSKLSSEHLAAFVLLEGEIFFLELSVQRRFESNTGDAFEQFTDPLY